MPRKQSIGVCLLFKSNHYFIPMGKMDQCPEGDWVWGFGVSGEHITFHISGEVHYIDENGNKTILNKKGSLKLFYTIFKNIFEAFKYMVSPERKFHINLLKHVQPAIKNKGCFEPNCKNRVGMAIKFDELLELLTQYMNENKKTYFQIGGSVENTFDPDEDEEDEYRDVFTDIVFPKLNIEKIPNCNFCIGKKYIQYNKKKNKFFLRNCPRCGGLGFELEELEKYKVGE